MAKAALISSAKIQSGADDIDFYETKITTARFYAEHFLPRVNGYLATVVAGSDSIMALKSEQF